MNAQRLISALALLGLASCQRPAPTPSAPTAAPASGACAAQETLAQMDSRRPVPLLPMMANHQKENMRGHLVAVQEIVTAASVDDFAGVERAAAKIGFSEQMGQMCEHMGAGAPGFTQQSLEFHHTADTIGVAARQHDRVAVMKALGVTLRLCTGCHASFRQSVVDEAAWSQSTGAAAPSQH